MNKLYVFLISAAIILGSCKTTVNEDSDLPLNGKWILVNVSAGRHDSHVGVVTQAERHLIVFGKNNSVSFLYNDSLLSTTSFLIEKRISIYSTDELDVIIYKSGLEPEVITYLSNDTLTLADNNYDGFTRVYIKQLD